MTTKTCFVISPIGGDGTDVRRRADQVLKHVISPPVENAGFEVVRADTISDPGMITTQIIEHIMNDDLVIADLTGHNPNVFYELAIRHATNKPFIQLINQNENIPFDVAGFRTIHFDHKDLDSVDGAKNEISKQIQAIQDPKYKLVTPLNYSIDMTALQSSGDAEDVYIPKIFDAISSLQHQLIAVENRLARQSAMQQKMLSRASNETRHEPAQGSRNALAALAGVTGTDYQNSLLQPSQIFPTETLPTKIKKSDDDT